jgi:hypothetical protein
MGATKLLAAGLAVAGLLGPASLAPAAASVTAAWSVVPSSDAMAPQGRLAGVSCVSATACVAVGRAVNRAGGEVALAERWNGAKWEIQDVPRPAGAQITSLSAVSCTSATACTAVGYYNAGGNTDLTLVERWNGTVWAIQPSPSPAAVSYLLGVSCTSATACTAVGAYQQIPALLTLAERWNGTRWAVQPTPTPAGYGTLSAVSCASATACTAVGSSSRGSLNSETVAEHWNGARWAVQPTPRPTTAMVLSGVSCPSVTVCVAVGSSTAPGAEGTLAERWDGTRWAVIRTPGPAGFDSLSGVSCTSASACTAVGYDTGVQSSTEATLAEAWNGTRWAVQHTPGPDHGQYMWLSGVSCGSAAACIAVGYNGTAAGITLTEARSGVGWVIRRSRSPMGALDSRLAGISCTSATACIAVGEVDDAPYVGPRPLAERWDGIRWAADPIASVPGALRDSVGSTSLSAVSCTSARACMAVGSYAAPGGTSGFAHGLAERWNGTKWIMQPIASPRRFRGSALSGVSCVSATACTAVGSYLTRTKRVHWLVLTERWNGRKWAVEAAPKFPAGSIAGVSCTSPTACTLVGSYDIGDNVLTLAERWNGARWIVQPTPDPAGSSQSALTGVSCASVTSCTAVGYASGTKSGIVDATLAERWNGTNWAIQPTPNPAGPVSELTGVSCASATSCTAAGDWLLAEAWTGSRWVIQRTATPAGELSGDFSGVSCLPAGSCTAIGRYQNANLYGNILVERRS